MRSHDRLNAKLAKGKIKVLVGCVRVNTRKHTLQIEEVVCVRLIHIEILCATNILVGFF